MSMCWLGRTFCLLTEKPAFSRACVFAAYSSTCLSHFAANMSLHESFAGASWRRGFDTHQFSAVHEAPSTGNKKAEWRGGKVQGFVEKQERTVSSVTGAGFFWASSPEPQPTFGKAAVGMLLSEALKSLWVHMFLSWSGTSFSCFSACSKQREDCGCCFSEQQGKLSKFKKELNSSAMKNWELCVVNAQRLCLSACLLGLACGSRCTCGMTEKQPKKTLDKATVKIVICLVSLSHICYICQPHAKH